MRKLLLAVAALLAASAASAQTALKLDGVYLFHTYEQVNQAPVCSEVWIFRRGGVMIVESGAERVRKRYRTETQGAGTWLISEMVSTNKKPDCTGVQATGVVRGERRVYLVPQNDGIIWTCPAPGKTETGAPYISGCFGALVLGSQAG